MKNDSYYRIFINFDQNLDDFSPKVGILKSLF